MILEILVLLASLLAFACYKVKQKHSTYWQNQGVKCPPVQFPMGSAPDLNNDVLFARVNTNDVARKQYHLMKGEKFYGVYKVMEGNLVFTDPELIKQVLVKDFNHFVDRMGPETIKMFMTGTRVDEIWRKQMVFTTGEHWKNARATFSPIFTSGKMKGMVKFIHEVNDRLMADFEKEAKNGTDFELKEKFGKFSMDSIASCAFGMDAQSFTNSKSLFVTYAQNIFKRYYTDILKIVMIVIPGGVHLMRLLQIAVFKPVETSFFDEAIQATIKERRRTNTRRNDLIDLMLDAMKENNNTGGDNEEEEEDGYSTKLDHKVNKKDLDDITIIATALIMLVAGYDTTGMTMSYAAYELAKNQEIQKRLQEEIDEAMEDSNGQLPDYNKIQSMEYLDMVFHETLRKYPALGALARACVEDYTIPGTSIKIHKGQELFINAAGIHSDPEYYPEPEKFNPEHFSKEAKANRHPYTFLGFGIGPRSCIGMRFAMLEAKIGLISMLSKYNVVRSKRTIEKVELDPASGLGASKHPLYVKLVHRNKN